MQTQRVMMGAPSEVNVTGVLRKRIIPTRFPVVPFDAIFTMTFNFVDKFVVESLDVVLT